MARSRIISSVLSEGDILHDPVQCGQRRTAGHDWKAAHEEQHIGDHHLSRTGKELHNRIF
jgi:hypothetical protein